MWQYAEHSGDFQKHVQRSNIGSWNALEAEYGLNGQVNDALHVYSQMLGYEFRPNGKTLLSFLSACSRSGKWNGGPRRAWSELSALWF